MKKNERRRNGQKRKRKERRATNEEIWYEELRNKIDINIDRVLKYKTLNNIII